MTDEPDSIVLRYLREIRAGQDAVRDTLAEHTQRFGHLETAVAKLTRDVADLHVILAEHSGRIDRVVTRLDRIDKRLDLVDSP